MAKKRPFSQLIDRNIKQQGPRHVSRLPTPSEIAPLPRQEKLACKFLVYKDAAKEWRWKFKASNGQIMADSSEGYKNKQDCLHAIDYVRDMAPFAGVFVVSLKRAT